MKQISLWFHWQICGRSLLYKICHTDQQTNHPYCDSNISLQTSFTQGINTALLTISAEQFETFVKTKVLRLTLENSTLPSMRYCLLKLLYWRGRNNSASFLPMLFWDLWPRTRTLELGVVKYSKWIFLKYYI